MFAASVEQLTDDKIKCDIGKADDYIEHGDLSADAQLLMDSFFIGVEMIANSYPANVRLTRRGSQ